MGNRLHEEASMYLEELRAIANNPQSTEADRRKALENLEQIELALTDLNIWGTGLVINRNPVHEPDGLCECLMHFIACCGRTYRSGHPA